MPRFDEPAPAGRQMRSMMRADTSPSSDAGQVQGDLPWWKTAVFYQIYPRSFLDTSGDGVGDLEGIRRRLGDLAWLGVDALWISPFFRSPMKDCGYDVADYCDVDPLFGTLADFDRLLADAHALGLRVVIDWVPNHTSDQHPWFLESRSSRHSAKRNWYVWRDAKPDGSPPNNWVGQFFRGPAWTFDDATQQYWLHCFLPEQPDLNWQESAVVEAMHETLRFWLDRGVDGLRMDVVHLIGKDPALPDDPEHLAGLTHVPLNHRPETHPLLREIRALLDSYPGDRCSVGEVFLLETSQIAEYYGDGDELHLCFNFLPLFTTFDAEAWRAQVRTIEAELAPRRAWPTWVLSNHDNQRHRTRYGSDARARAAVFVLLGLRGTPFLYAGEELGLADADVPEARRLDPGMRDGCRAPIPWDETPAHGWILEDNWLPWPPDAASRSFEAERRDADSMLHLYRRLLAARRASPALRSGEQELPGFGEDVDRDVLAIRRRDAGGDERIVVVNFGSTERAVALTGRIEVATDAALEGREFSGVVAAESALLLKPFDTPMMTALAEAPPLRRAYFDTVFLVPDPPETLPRRFAIVTACNPEGEGASPEYNEEATRELVRHLDEQGLASFEVTGASFDLSHREPGRAFAPRDVAEASRISRHFRQEAFFWVEDGVVYLCNDASGRGWRVDAWSARVVDRMSGI